jgi:lipoprotein-releasing system ATP-binding protein
MEDRRPGVIMEARDLRKIYRVDNGKNAAAGGIDVLKGMNFKIRAGETVAVVGKSGIGKSSLLHIMGALDRPSGGNLLFKGRDIFKYGDDRLARFRNRSVGFVFQFHHLLKEFSTLENTMMPMLIRGTAFGEARSRAEEILEQMGLGDRMSHMVGKLSGGERQRAALARALIGRPDILLADEPTGNLDKTNSDQAHELLLKINRELGMTMVVATHDMELAAAMSRRMTIIDGNIMEQNGSFST